MIFAETYDDINSAVFLVYADMLAWVNLAGSQGKYEVSYETSLPNSRERYRGFNKHM